MIQARSTVTIEAMELHTALSILRAAVGLGALVYVAKLVFQPMIEQREREKEQHEVDEYLRRIDPDYNRKLDQRYH